jgi:hypothetical protein
MITPGNPAEPRLLLRNADIASFFIRKPWLPFFLKPKDIYENQDRLRVEL